MAFSIRVRPELKAELLALRGAGDCEVPHLVVGSVLRKLGLAGNLSKDARSLHLAAAQQQQV